MQVKASGSMVKGPRPESLKPVSLWSKGLDVREYRRSAIENMIRPRLNFDSVLW